MLLKIYKIFFSPILKYLFGGGCRYSPTCSEYADQVITKYGIFKGSYLATRRILSCSPLTKI